MKKQTEKILIAEAVGCHIGCTLGRRIIGAKSQQERAALLKNALLELQTCAPTRSSEAAAAAEGFALPVALVLMDLQ